jgi:AmmeMemoRadiSam system protein A
MLTQDERGELLMIARAAVERAARGERARRVETHGGALGAAGGAFVTLRCGGDLRGCIGYIESELPLGEVVAEVATKAALEDPRFPPVTVQELDRITIEVSVLSNLRPVKDVDEVEVGEHGLLLELGQNRGLLLPQVATEYGWDREQFLAHTARKAGLPEKSWGDPRAKLFIFSAEVFDEGQAD